MRSTTGIRLIAAALLAGYAAVVARLTLFPADTETGAFGTLSTALTRASSGRLDWAQIEVIGNVALFVPFGFLVAIVCARAWPGVLAGVATSAAIEAAQAAFLPSRVPTIADVEHNALGALIGAAIAWPLAIWIRRARRAARDHRSAGKPPTPPLLVR